MRSLAIISPVLITLAAAVPAEAPPNLPPLDSHEYAVLRTLMLSMATHQPSSFAVHADVHLSTKEIDEAVSAAEREMPDLESSTIDTFVVRNKAGGHFEDRFGLPHPVRPLRDAELKTFVTNRPEAAYFGILSRVGVNHDHTQALVYVTGAYGEVFELLKIKGQWKVIQRVIVWMPPEY